MYTAKKVTRHFYSGDIYASQRPSSSTEIKLKIKGRKEKKALAQITSHVSVRNARVLDIGCGDAEFMTLLSPKHKYGVDINRRAVKRARKRGVNAQVMDVETEKLPYPNNYFDLVLCMEVFEHLFDPTLLVSEIGRVLKKGGHVYATVPNDLYWLGARLNVLFGKPFLQSSMLIPHHHVRFFNKKLLSGLFKEESFEIIYLGGFHSKRIPSTMEHFLAKHTTNLFVSNFSILVRKS